VELIPIKTVVARTWTLLLGVCVAMRREFSADVCQVKLMGVYGRPDRLKNVAGQVVGSMEWSAIAYVYCRMHEA